MGKFDETKMSKFLSLILRHSPEIIGITLDANGWVKIDELRKALKSYGKPITGLQLEQIVKNDSKQRYSILNGKIRANQGHSIAVDLQFVPVAPPDVLFHGTVKASLDAIFESGLIPMSRQYVHLSTDIETATVVGSRKGQPIILRIDAKRCYDDGNEFFCSENKVWLTKHISPLYISFE